MSTCQAVEKIYDQKASSGMDCNYLSSTLTSGPGGITLPLGGRVTNRYIKRNTCKCTPAVELIARRADVSRFTARHALDQFGGALIQSGKQELRPVVIFGTGQIADVARVYLEQAGIKSAGSQLTICLSLKPSTMVCP